MKNLVVCLTMGLGILTTQLHVQAYGTFYLQSSGNAPWPFDPYGGAEPITVLDASNHIYFVEDSAEDFAAMQEMNASMSLMSEDEMEMDSMSMNSSLNDPLDVGTNLWLEITGLTNNVASLRLSNTVADVQYEILGISDLLNTNWISEGFCFGSEITNWTATTADASDFPNHFYWARSWGDSDGNGIADWWELQHFGHTGIDPFADEDGDGFNDLAEFLNGTDPAIFDTPTKPQLNVTYNLATKIATATWSPLFGFVTGYLLIKYDWQTHLWTTNSLSSTATSFNDDLSADVAYDYANHLHVQYQLQAHYFNGDTVSSDWFNLESGAWRMGLAEGMSNAVYLIVPSFPSDATAFRLTRVNAWAWEFGDHSLDTNFDIPVSSFTNGMFLLTSNMTANPIDSYGRAQYGWFGTIIGANTSDAQFLNGLFSSYADGGNTWWIMPPYYDGRRQLKENLIFLFRAALKESVPFHWQENNFDPNDYYTDYWTNPPTYEYASFFKCGDANGWYQGQFDCFLPFEDNYLYRNFVFDLSQVNSSGGIKTGVGGTYNNGGIGLSLNNPPTNQFHLPVSSSTIPCFTNSVRWLASYPVASSSVYLGKIGITNYIQTSPFLAFVTAMSGSAKNYWGLPFVSALVAFSSVNTNVLYAGTQVYSNWSNFFPETAQPQFQTVEYNFWLDGYGSPLPGFSTFSTSQTSDKLIVPVGNSISINGYAKLVVTNANNGVYGYLGQYFDKAYKITNGVVAANETGILSPYGDFLATELGVVALVTMPDIDTGTRGTGTVYCISMNVDANHDGEMDLSFTNSDFTSQIQPMRVWVNNGYIKVNSNGDLDEDLPLPNNNPKYANCAQGKITCQRDLENFFRLWVCGVPSLPVAENYSFTLSFENISGSPAVNLYSAVETNGGIGYLTDTNIAAQQAELNPPYAYGISMGTISNGCSLEIPNIAFAFGGTQHFLFEGAGVGSGELVLTISKNGNPIAQTGVWLDLHDIKDFYEQADATNVTSGLPPSSLVSQYRVDHVTETPSDETKQIVVFVHGINNSAQDYYDSTDLIFKRLYWSGYHGKVAGFKWPCAFLPPDATVNPLDYLKALNYNKGEFYAWKSATALKNYLCYLTNRFADYQIDIFGHSQGNIVASEAIKQGAPFDNYILTQAAVPADCYDTSVPFVQKFLDAETNASTPLNVANGGYHGCFTNLPGNFINFYNTNDYALRTGAKTFLFGLITVDANWEANEISRKPENFSYMFGPSYSYDGTNCQRISYFFVTSQVTDLQEARAMVARSRTHALGAQENANGLITSSIDLVGTFKFDRTRDDHSAQFKWPVQRIWGYYDAVLRAYNLQPITR